MCGGDDDGSRDMDDGGGLREMEWQRVYHNYVETITYYSAT